MDTLKVTVAQWLSEYPNATITLRFKQYRVASFQVERPIKDMVFPVRIDLRSVDRDGIGMLVSCSLDSVVQDERHKWEKAIAEVEASR